MGLPGYTLVFSRGHAACVYAGRREVLEVMCGAAAAAAGAGNSSLPPRLGGSPLVAYAVRDGRAGSVLVGIVTGQPAGNADIDVRSRTPDPGTRISDPRTRNPEPRTRNPEPGTRSGDCCWGKTRFVRLSDTTAVRQMER
jgi:hypothetical protein